MTRFFLSSVRGVDVTARNQVGFKAVSITIRERQARPVVVPAARAGTDNLTSENLYCAILNIYEVYFFSYLRLTTRLTDC